MDTQEVLEECVRFPSYGDRYYQITAIDEYSRKRLGKSICKDVIAQTRPVLILALMK